MGIEGLADGFVVLYGIPYFLQQTIQRLSPGLELNLG